MILPTTIALFTAIILFAVARSRRLGNRTLANLICRSKIQSDEAVALPFIFATIIATNWPLWFLAMLVLHRLSSKQRYQIDFVIKNLCLECSTETIYRLSMTVRSMRFEARRGTGDFPHPNLRYRIQSYSILVYALERIFIEPVRSELDWAEKNLDAMASQFLTVREQQELVELQQVVGDLLDAIEKSH